LKFVNNVVPTELIEFDCMYYSTILPVLRTCLSHRVAILWVCQAYYFSNRCGNIPKSWQSRSTGIC